MKTKDFCAAIEAGFERAYDNSAGFATVPYVDKPTGDVRECLGLLLSKGEHFAVVVAHAAHWIVNDPDATFAGDRDDLGDYEAAQDRLEDFYNLVGGMHTAPYMSWTCVYFPGLTEAQVLASDEAGHDGGEDRLANVHIELAPPADQSEAQLTHYEGKGN
jgi:hypothetical protein